MCLWTDEAKESSSRGNRRELLTHKKREAKGLTFVGVLAVYK